MREITMFQRKRTRILQTMGICGVLSVLVVAMGCGTESDSASPPVQNLSTGQPESSSGTLAASSASTSTHGREPVRPANVAGYAEAGNQFGLKLYDLLSQDQNSGANLFISPYSISSALHLTMQGAAKQTLDQMWKALVGNRIAETPNLEESAEAYGAIHEQLKDVYSQGDLSKSDEKGKDTLKIANALWGMSDFEARKQYLDRIEKFFGGGYHHLNQTPEKNRKTINQWVAQQTNDLIQDLLPGGSITDQTRLVLTNAIYFKGTWAHPFNPDATQPRPFVRAYGREELVPMMHQPNGRFAMLEKKAFSAISLPYEGDELHMVVLLPEKDVSLSALEKTLDMEMLQSTLKQLDAAQPQSVDVMLPKFEMRWKQDISSALQALGITDAFTDKANFSRMTENWKNLWVSGVFHETYIAVDEVGTEAAGATGVVVGITSVMPDKAKFHANKPFVFLIRHRPTGVILFLGRLTDPAQTESGA